MWRIISRNFSASGKSPEPKQGGRLHYIMVATSVIAIGIFQHYSLKHHEDVKDLSKMYSVLKNKSRIKPPVVEPPEAKPILPTKVEDFVMSMSPDVSDKSLFASFIRSEVQKSQEKPSPKQSKPSPPKPTQSQPMSTPPKEEPKPKESSSKVESKAPVPETVSKPTESLSKPPENIPKEPSKTIEKPPSQAVIAGPPEEIQKMDAKLESLKNSFSELTEELRTEQNKREEELLSRLETSLSQMLEGALPQLSPVPAPPEISTPASVITSHLNFAELSAQQVKQAFEELISAYEDRIQQSGIKNYEGFLDQIKSQKQKWIEKVNQIKQDHQNELLSAVEVRDNDWKALLAQELENAEKHFEEQSRLDADFIEKRTTLELSEEHQRQIAQITDDLRVATQERLEKLDSILKRIQEMEEIQTQHYKIILKLERVHQLHTTIESIQRTLNVDEGTLTADFKKLGELARDDFMITAALNGLAQYYGDILEKGIPTVTQIHRTFQSATKDARRAALRTSDHFLSHLTANFAYWFIPSNIKRVDDQQTFDIIRRAEGRLERGDIKGTAEVLNELKGYPRSEVQHLIHEIHVRLSVVNLVEVLSALASSLVKDLIVMKKPT